MNKNEQDSVITNLPSEFSAASCEFQEKLIISRNVWLALGCAAIVLTAKGYNRLRERRAERLDQEIEQFYVDNPAKTDPAK
jgi:hypothetical protein